LIESRTLVYRDGRWQRAQVGVLSLSNDRLHLTQLLEAAAAEAENILGGDLVGSQVEYL